MICPLSEKNVKPSGTQGVYIVKAISNEPWHNNIHSEENNREEDKYLCPVGSQVERSEIGRCKYDYPIYNFIDVFQAVRVCEKTYRGDDKEKKKGSESDILGYFNYDIFIYEKCEKYERNKYISNVFKCVSVKYECAKIYAN